MLLGAPPAGATNTYTPEAGVPAAPSVVDQVVAPGGTIGSTCGSGLANYTGITYNTIGDAVTNASPGDTIYVCAGTYAETVDVSTDNLTIDGAQWSVAAPGRSAPESDITPALNADAVDYTGDVPTGTLQGFTLTGVADATSPVVGINDATDTAPDHFTWENNVIDGFTVGITFHASGAGGTTDIEGNSFVDNVNDPSNGEAGQGIFADSGASNNVDVSANAFSGDFVPTATNPDADDADINTTGDSFGTIQTGWTIENNTSTGAGNFLVLFETSDAVVENNTVTGNNEAAFYIGGDNTGTTISGNSISGGVGLGAEGFQLVNSFYNDSADLTISGNTISGQQIGIEGDDAYTGTVISGNTITGSAIDGIDMMSGATGYTFTGNNVSGSGTDDYTDASSGSGSGGTGNTYTGNQGGTSSPAGVLASTAFSITINGAQSATVVSGSGGSVILAETGLASAATGTVTFKTGSTTVCSVTLSGASGEATGCSAAPPTATGTSTIAASFSGTGIYTNSTSANTVSLTVNPVPPPPPTPTAAGYDLVGSDGGVFVFPTGQSAGFYGSLPGLGIHVNNIVGMTPAAGDLGYYLVGSDGGVFAFGSAPYLGSLPGLGVHVSNIVGIIPTAGDTGYYLIGSDGGVFAFGNAPFVGSLPGQGVHISNVVGIAVGPQDKGYWLATSTGQVYQFGTASNFGSVVAPVTAISATPDGGGYWLVGPDGGVFAFGNAGYGGSLPGLGIHVGNIIGIVPSMDDGGYLLIGSDGGVFAFGDATFEQSIPGLGIHINNIVGAVPTLG
jgi:parallel beta-helix repeat protein